MAKQSEATLLLRIKQVGQEAISKTADALDSLKGVALAAYAQISVAVGVALKAWHDQEQATNALNQSLINQGIYTRELSSAYQQIASDLQLKSTFADEDIQQAMASAQVYLGQTKITKELTQAILDFAQAQGMDAASAAKVLGKSIGTSTNALARYGIEINSALPANEKMAEVIGKITSKFGGQAEAATKGLGALIVMKNSLGEIAEAAGKAIAPAFTIAAQHITDFANKLSTSNEMMRGFATVAVFALKVADTIVTSFQTLGASIGAIFAAIGSFSITNFSKSMDQIKAINQQVTLDNENAWKESKARQAEYDRALLDSEKPNAEESKANAKASADAKIRIEQDRLAIHAADYDKAKIEEQIKENEYGLIKQDAELTRQLTTLNAKIAGENDYVAKLALLRQKEQLIEDANNKAKMAGADAYTKFRIYLASQEGQAVTQTLTQVSSLQNAKSKEVAAIGKAAAIAQATINTYLAITQALAHIPPPFNFAAAGAIGAAGFAQVANIAGVQLAEGGIVRATPGGIQATIGEGGKDEAVIPLDSPEAAGRLGGGSVTVNFNGPVMGDESQAREFAIAIDRQLMKLRRDGESVSFDERIS